MSSRMLLSVEDAAAGLSAHGIRQEFTFSSARALRVAFSSAKKGEKEEKKKSFMKFLITPGLVKPFIQQGMDSQR